MNTKLKVLLSGVAVAGLLFAAMPAQAAPKNTPEPISPANSVLATPEDLKILGFDQAAIDAQQAAWDALSNSARQAQTALHAEQSAGKPDLATVPVYNVAPPSSGISPMTVYPNACADAPNGYKIGIGATQPTSYTCYIGVGIFNYGTNEYHNVVNLRPGSESGRVLYHYYMNPTYYWSVDRGPNDFNSYYFSQLYGSVYVKEVQLY